MNNLNKNEKNCKKLKIGSATKNVDFTFWLCGYFGISVPFCAFGGPRILDLGSLRGLWRGSEGPLWAPM